MATSRCSITLSFALFQEACPHSPRSRSAGRGPTRPRRATPATPRGAYALEEGNKGPFLLDDSKPNPVILGRYGPDSWGIDKILGALESGKTTTLEVTPTIVPVGGAMEKWLINFVPKATKKEQLLVHPRGVRES